MSMNADILAFNSIEFLRNNIKMQEKRNELNRKPNQEDIEELKEILLGFKIKKDIPEFDSIKELNSWRRKMIYEKLNNKK